ncbi:MAG: hypothetical protein HQL12_06815 [Candidatus Omnitrophica bacterium]|nr:hypothetical protein [Candidatus Omnitrophota bacterium]
MIIVLKAFLSHSIVWMMRLLFIFIATAAKSNQHLILSIVLLMFMVFHAFNGAWVGDFWMHSDVVHELATHPFSPKHPELLMDAPHSFYSPYSLGIALIAKIFNINSIMALSIGGIFNFLLFLIGLNMFVPLLLGNNKGAFYTLFFTLFLWGPGVWNYSGFFHFGVIGYVLPYPSTFAMGLILLSLSMVILFLRDKSKMVFFGLLGFSVIILLSHPLSAILLYTGILALVTGYKDPLRPSSRTDSVFILSVIPLSFLIALAWPYYPLLKLILGDGALLDLNNSCMFQGVLKIIFPALIGLPILVLRARSDWKDPLFLMFSGLVLVYVYGWLTGHFIYGRVISFMILILHMSIADWACKNENFKILTVRGKCFLATILVFALLGVLNNCNMRCINYMPGIKNNYSQYQFLTKYTKQYDVVLSDPETSLFIPSFGGKVIANSGPMPFIEHYERRQNDLKSFFNIGASLKFRENIIKRYGVNFILINQRMPVGAGLPLGSMAALGRKVYADQNFILIKVGQMK